MGDIHIHVHIHEANPETGAALERIEAALEIEKEEIEDMTKITDAALKRIEDAVAAETTVIDSALAFIDANVQATRDLAAEMAAEGADVTKLNAFADATEANRTRLAAKLVVGTPADTGTTVPDFVRT